MKKRIFALALALVMILSLLPVSASAAQNGTWGSNINWKFQNGVLTISGKGAMDDAGGLWDENDEYQYIETPWAELEITKVVVESGVTHIGNYAFSGLFDLETAVLADTVTSIGESAFEYCPNLSSIDLPANLTTIGDWAFSYCQSLTGKLTIPGKVTTIGAYAFSNTGLTEVTIPASVNEIFFCPFAYSRDLKTIKVDQGNTSYDSDSQGALYSEGKTELIQVPGAFSGTFTIPETVTALYDTGFFNGCHAMEKVIIPASTTEIDPYIFASCTGLKTIEVNSDNPVYYSRDGILYGEAYAYDENYNELIVNAILSCPSAKDLGDFTVPANVQMLEYSCFASCTKLTSITIPAGCAYFGDYIFEGCTGLQNIHIAAGNPRYYSVDGVVFNQDVTIEDFDPERGDFVDRHFPKGTLLELFPTGRAGFYAVPEGVTDIDANAFAESAIQAVRFPSTLKSLHECALTGCDALEWICFTGDKPEVRYYGISVDEATIYYPAANTTWAEPTLENAGDELTYVPYAAGKEPTWAPNPFTDVPAGSFYEAPVLWAVKNGITNGLSATEFGPTATCNRAQVVTFLWRAAGCPEPTSTKNPFVDVQAGSFYEKPVLWAVEMGITNGADATHFNPNGVCNRAQVVTFLYRAFESPAVSTSGLPFTDVPAGSWYEAPIAWAVENGITNGLSATEFGPNSSCNRAQVVTFLYRAYNN